MNAINSFLIVLGNYGKFLLKLNFMIIFFIFKRPMPKAFKFSARNPITDGDEFSINKIYPV